jgi:tetratricopeptide (TPR) repeat protein
MRRILALLLLFSAVAWGQANSDSESDSDWQDEIDLVNRFFQAGDDPGAYAHARKSLEIAQRKHLGPRFVAGSEWAMAEALRDQRKFAEAEALHRDALKLRESVLPPTHYRVLQSVQSLAVTLYAEQKNDEADPLFVRAIAGYNQMSERDGPDECSYGVALADLGYIRLQQHRYDQAEGLMLRATKSWAEIGSECGELHGLWDKLAALYFIQGQPEKAEPLYRQAIHDLTPEEGERPDPHYAHYIGSLGGFYVQQKRYAEAEPLLKQGISLLEQDPLANPGEMEATAQNYITLLKATNRLDEVPPLERRIDSLHHAEAAFGRSPAERWDAIWKMAEQAMQEKRWAEAEKGLRDALALNDSLPKEDARWVQSYLNLAGLYQQQSRSRDAENVLQEGIQAAEKSGIHTPTTLNLYGMMSVLKMLAGDLEAQESILRHSIELRQKWGLEPEAGELGSLAHVLRQRGRSEEAVKLARRAVQLAEVEYGPDAMALTSSLEALGLSCEADRKFDEAEAVYKRILAIEEKQFGPSHLVLVGSLSHLLSIYRKAGRMEEARQVEARIQALRAQQAH